MPNKNVDKLDDASGHVWTKLEFNLSGTLFIARKSIEAHSGVYMHPHIERCLMPAPSERHAIPSMPQAAGLEVREVETDE